MHVINAGHRDIGICHGLRIIKVDDSDAVPAAICKPPAFSESPQQY